MYKTEFYETAVQLGFYGIERGGLFGKKDNVRKYWEDISIKLAIQPAIEKLLQKKDKIRIADLGCGSGEGYELLTHIPVKNPFVSAHKAFLLSGHQIDACVGLDISPSMIEQGRMNYQHLSNVKFLQADLSKGFPLLSEEPFDLYFSSYASLSHLSRDELRTLTEQILSHISKTGYLVYDLFGRFSPEWPKYWNKTNKEMLPYNMTYLLPQEELTSEKIQWFDVTFWAASELGELIRKIAANKQKQVSMNIYDRSILLGRHMGTGLFSDAKLDFRYQVNRLFDRDYRGEVEKLKCDLSFLQGYRDIQPQAWQRICNYQSRWNSTIELMAALLESKNDVVKKLIESATPEISEEFRMLAWLHRNAARFPVVDFWASIMGPQVACVLRNFEFTLPPGLGCGHGLFAIIEIQDTQ